VLTGLSRFWFEETRDLVSNHVLGTDPADLPADVAAAFDAADLRGRMLLCRKASVLPVEVWSMVSWLIYGIYLHLRVTFGWRGRRLAWYALIALAAMIVSYWGIPFSVETFHTGFRIDHN
ncbi:MAG: cytochrome c biogenesis protein CcsA, partial [Deltaproteobacteria bacterium]|nr:cytochrome c biogenesis protein CcsA [Deltaproteobacteria bacterium]